MRLIFLRFHRKFFNSDRQLTINHTSDFKSDYCLPEMFFLLIWRIKLIDIVKEKFRRQRI
jgi:hypothetical protein